MKEPRRHGQLERHEEAGRNQQDILLKSRQTKREGHPKLRAMGDSEQTCGGMKEPGAFRILILVGEFGSGTMSH